MLSLDAPANETQATIEAWADETFGKSANLSRALARANEEMAELIKACATDASPEKIVKEAADVTIVLCRPASICGTDLTPIMSLREVTVEPATVIAVKANAILAHAMQLAICDRVSASSVGIYIDLIVAMMAKLCASLGLNLDDEVNDKMAVNRGRSWRLDGTGHGYHRPTLVKA